MVNEKTKQKENLHACQVRPQFVDTLFIVRSRPNISMRRAVIINYQLVLVHKIEIKNLILLYTQVLLVKPNKVSLS